jgi:hypothetical protein
MNAILRRVSMLLLALGAVVLFYVAAVRPWMMSWGTTAEERARSMPGDEIVPDSALVTTRAVGIGAAAERVWPWLAQLGQDRGGFYSYELLEDLAGCEMPRAGEILPAAQEWRPGDQLWMYPPDKLDGVGGAPLLASIPGRALAFGTWNPTTPHTRPPDGSWAFVLEPVSADSSRLLVRSRGAAPTGFAARLFHFAVFEPIHFVMERRMMDGIRRHAEVRPPHTRAADAAQIAIWAAMFVLFLWGIVATLRRGRWYGALGATVAAAFGFLVTTLGQPPAFVGLLLVAAVVALLFGRGGDAANERAAGGDLLTPATAA